MPTGQGLTPHPTTHTWAGPGCNIGCHQPSPALNIMTMIQQTRTYTVGEFTDEEFDLMPNLRGVSTADQAAQQVQQDQRVLHELGVPHGQQLQA
jgi:hypothetical protein